MIIKTTHFRVGNGDMTLIELPGGRRILIDINIRSAADDTDDDTPDVATQLRDRLVRDGDGRLYVDAFLLTHPDADHIRGLMKHFHLGPPADWDKDDDKIVIAAHRRRKKGRKPLPKDLPRVDIIHDLDEDEKQCACGVKLSRIGEDVCEKLDYVPARLRVERHVRYKYACKNCEGVDDDGPTVRIAPAPVQLIPKSNATAGLLAHIAVSKFADGLPLYRQEKIFSRLGIDLSRAVMAKWMVKTALHCKGLIDLLEDEIRGGPLINIDETILQVLNETGRSNTAKSYMWVYRGGTPDRQVLLYHYHPTRSGRVALKFIEDFSGYIQTDDYAGYDHLGQKTEIVHMGCWAHARRKFVKVVQVRKKHRSKRTNPKSLADEALKYIRRLYRIEKEARQGELNTDEIYQLRQEKSKPLLDKFNTWLTTHQPLTPPKGLLGQAISYTLSNWDKLIVYLQDGLLRPDNNLVENAIRPFVVGRKNWLFAGSPDGAQASAVFFNPDRNRQGQRSGTVWLSSTHL